ncbi:MAG: hypothetical protein QHH02_01450 [Syntrophomonadaceae bacterium]|nr:hypothetical protein [Syntrophomonadaceae bacterium]
MTYQKAIPARKNGVGELASNLYENLKVTSRAFGELIMALVSVSRDYVSDWVTRGGLTSVVVLIIALFFIAMVIAQQT